jgi:hypothetical protein
MSFDKLLADLQSVTDSQETLAKALPQDDGKDDDKAIQAAAGEGEGGAAAGDGDADDKGGAADGDADDKPMAKSFKVKLADGTEVEAEDGTEMIKSLTARLDASEGTMTKALESCIGLIKGQQDMIKSLGDQVTKLRGEGRGRKAIVSINDKPDNVAAGNADLKKSEQGVTPEVFMAKALDAMSAGKLTGMDVSLAEACLNRGEQVPASIVSRVLA